jgi:ParB family chromosome partitioning protein
MNKPISSSLMFISLEKLIPDNDPIRKDLSQEHIQDLKDSFSLFKALGPLDPLLVMPVEGGNYLILSGNHRYMALKESKAAEAPCHVVEPANDAEIFLMKLHANTKRKSLTDLEACEALAREKAIYEKLYPQTRQGHNAKKQNAQNACSSQPGYAEWKAQAIGVSPSTIRRDVQVGELVQEMHELKDAEATKGDVLDLAKRKPEEREVVKQALQASANKAGALREYLRRPPKQKEEKDAIWAYRFLKDEVRIWKNLPVDWNELEFCTQLFELEAEILPQYIQQLQRELSRIRQLASEKRRQYS